MLFLIAGKKRSGKDTVAKILIEELGGEAVALADNLREMCSAVFRVPMNYFTDDDKKEKEFPLPVEFTIENSFDLEYWCTDRNGFSKDQVAGKFTKFIGTAFKTPRAILQVVGTEMVRECVDDYFHCKVLDRRIGCGEEQLENVFVTDCRFKNERAYFDGIKVLVVNPAENVTAEDLHASEQEIGEPSEYDIVIENDKTLGLDMLRENVRRTFQRFY